MLRIIRKYCARCHKEIFDNEDFKLEGDKRGVVNRIYHTRCVMVKKVSNQKAPILQETEKVE